MGGGPALSVPATAGLLDEPVAIRVTGCAPGEVVRISATVDDSRRGRWRSWAVFEADPAGAVDLARARPREGSYATADPLGLFWSLAMDPAAPGAVSFGTPAEPVVVQLGVEVNGLAVARGEVRRLLMGPGVQRIAVHDAGLVGAFFRPAGTVERPGVLVIGGSDGGLSENLAALLASHGFAALALAYFRLQHLPPDLVEIPLEYFETALGWLGGQPGVARGGLGVVGRSRGGELALLLAAMFPEIRAVVGYVPSGLVHAGISGTAGGAAGPRSAWTWQGKPLPFLPAAGPAPVTAPAGSEAPIELRPAFLRSLEDTAAVEAAAIPGERIRGPVLLLSGQDDRLWPSPVLAELAVQRLAARGFPHTVEHRSYPQAGHMIGPAGMPATVDAILHPLRGIRLALGGTPAGNAAAAADSWPRVLEFLGTALRPAGSR